MQSIHSDVIGSFWSHEYRLGSGDWLSSARFSSEFWWATIAVLLLTISFPID